MFKAIREVINKFGEDSLSEIIPHGNTFQCVRKDGAVIAEGKELKGYMGDIIRTMYTGWEYASGDYVLMSDRHGMICKFK